MAKPIEIDRETWKNPDKMEIRDEQRRREIDAQARSDARASFERCRGTLRRAVGP